MKDSKPEISKGVYTAREVVEILEKAKALDCISLKLAGFEAEFKPQSDFGSAPTTSAVPVGTDKWCSDCSSLKVPGRSGLYCKRCYIEKKEAQKRKW